MQLQQFLDDPQSVDEDWRIYFSQLLEEQGLEELQKGLAGPLFSSQSIFDPDGVLVHPEVQVFSSARKLSLLRNVLLFREVSEDELIRVAKFCRHIEKSDSQFLFREGEKGQELYIVASGTVLVKRGEKVVATLGRGEVLGEIAVLDGLPRSADAIAHGEGVHLLALSEKDLKRLLEDRPRLALSVIRMLSGRLRKSASGQDAVDQLIRAYRVRGHRCADLDPLSPPKPYDETLQPEFYGFSSEDLELTFSSRTIPGKSYMTLKKIVERMRKSYCGSIGIQFMHIDDIETKYWIQERLEGVGQERRLNREEQLKIFSKLADAEIFEQFIHRKFLGAKRFSLEGGESLIPLMEQLIEEAAIHNVDEIVIGMAHRGRLNVLANVMEKSPREIFREFDDDDPSRIRDMKGRGDVKYHLGYSHDRITSNGKKIHLSLSFNPSHLECVGPVVMGRVRAKQARDSHGDRSRRMAIVIHGDAAFAGQGIVQEMLNMSELPGFTIGGTLHIILNNQIGFTTPPESARSTEYATDVARMLQIPIIHVNGEDPEAVARALKLALDFRQKFGKDVVVDMYCYRRHGHNETDEPAYTQPVLYRNIRARKSVREAYLGNLLSLGELTRDEANQIAKNRKTLLEKELAAARSSEYQPLNSFAPGKGIWSAYGNSQLDELVDTRVDKDVLKGYLTSLAQTPPEFNPHPKISNLLKLRAAMVSESKALDWAAGEMLGYASLLATGKRIRFVGQDVGRGTFSHRHAVLHDFETGKEIIPLNRLGTNGAEIEIWDSPLTETAVLAFEYGFSLDSPDVLTMWEAQFGDFANMAQVIIDQFISSGEEKWGRLSGLCLFLPHGYEGQGPEHSSARLERFLAMAAENNYQILNLTTPAQIFHMIRRQQLRRQRKPLVLMSPKSLLRHPKAVSSFDELAEGQFHTFIRDVPDIAPKKVKCILLTSGKLYYELEQYRRDHEFKEFALVRMEQLYPVDLDCLSNILHSYHPSVPVRWVQDEPQNMGAWSFIQSYFGNEIFGRPLTRVCRKAAASPATGSNASHKLEQKELLEMAFAPPHNT